MQHHISREIYIPILPYRQFVRAGKQQDLFRSLELVEISQILPINPNARSLLDFGRAFQLQFAEHVISGISSFDRERETGKHESTDPSRHVVISLAHAAVDFPAAVHTGYLA